MRRLAIWLIIALLLTSCGLFGSHAQELANLQKEAVLLFEQAPHSGNLPKESWPPALRALHPKFVYARREGIYIVMSALFVAEKGLFLPRSSSYQPPSGSDPSYQLIVQGLYSYELRG